jgi:hypothetical protein
MESGRIVHHTTRRLNTVVAILPLGSSLGGISTVVFALDRAITSTQVTVNLDNSTVAI